jgi:hypothetical protein
MYHSTKTYLDVFAALDEHYAAGYRNLFGFVMAKFVIHPNAAHNLVNAWLAQNGMESVFDKDNKV